MEQDNHLPQLTSDIVIDAPQDTAGPSSCLDTLLAIYHQPRAPDHSLVPGLWEPGQAHMGSSMEKEKLPCRGLVFFFFWKTSLKHSTPLLMYQRDRDGISRFFLFAALAVVHVWVFVPCSKTYGKLLAHMGLKRASVRQFKLQNNQKTGFAFQAGECGNHLTLSRLSSLCHFYIFCSDYIHFLCLPFCQDLSATQIPVKIVFCNHGISHCEHIWSEHFWCSHPFSLW